MNIKEIFERERVYTASTIDSYEHNKSIDRIEAAVTKRIEELEAQAETDTIDSEGIINKERWSEGHEPDIDGQSQESMNALHNDSLDRIAAVFTKYIEGLEAENRKLGDSLPTVTRLAILSR